MSSRGLLAHVVTKFAPRQWENIASESLLYLLERPGGQAGIKDLVTSLGVRLGPVSWQAQAQGSTDAGIPDLVGSDDQSRPVIIIESKFWASLTSNQPDTYLQRQFEAFGDNAEGHVLLFIAPERRLDLLTVELEGRLGVQHRESGSVRVLASPRGLVAVASWLQVLSHLRVALEATGDQEGLDDLSQLRGLCDRADQTAMQPLSQEDMAQDRARRQVEFCDIVNGVVDRLVALGHADTKGLKATGTQNWWGRYVRWHANDRVMRIYVSTWSWSTRYPTPWWVFVWSAEADDTGFASLAGRSEIPLIAEVDGGHLFALEPPLGVEKDRIVEHLAQAVGLIAQALPRADGLAEVTTDGEE